MSIFLKSQANCDLIRSDIKMYTEIITMLSNGVKPVIEFNKLIEKYDYDPDAGMRFRIISCTKVDEYNCIWFKCDMSEFMDLNKQIAKPDWYDENNNPTLTWFESSFYPNDNIFDMCVGINDEDCLLDIISENNSYYYEYLNSKSEISYVVWLENKLTELIKS